MSHSFCLHMQVSSPVMKYMRVRFIICFLAFPLAHSLLLPRPSLLSVSGISKVRTVLWVSSLELSPGFTLLLLLLLADFNPQYVPSSTSGDVSRQSYPTTSGDISRLSSSMTSRDVSRSGYGQYCTPLNRPVLHAPRTLLSIHTNRSNTLIFM